MNPHGAAVLPAYSHVPEFYKTYGDEVGDLAAQANFPPDPQQQMALDLAFARRPDGLSVAFEMGLVVGRQNLKALSTDTPILTSAGWQTMATIQVGDEVYHPDGHTVSVTEVSWTRAGNRCYRVTTTDGRSVIADAGHLWSVDDRRWKRQRVLTTQHMMDFGLRNEAECRYQLPRQRALKTPHAELPAHSRFTVGIESIEQVESVPVRCIKVGSADGLFLAGRGLIPTHNTGFFKQAGLGWLYLFDEKLVVYSAHEFITAMEMFRDMEELVKGSDFLRREVKRVIRSHGEEAIELLSGARMIFKTRTKGGGRGLSGRKVVLDEGYALRAMHMGALLPTLSAQPDPQVFYGSSAGMADSEVLRDVRDRGRGERKNADGTKIVDPDPRLGYLEWAAPPPEIACDAGTGCTHAKSALGCGCDKPDMWLKANPAIGHRISLDYVKAERRALPVSEFCRERMGWWDDPEEGATPLAMGLWFLRADKRSTPDSSSPLALAISVAPDSSMAAIALAGFNGKRTHVELAEHMPGVGWLMDRLMGIVERRDPCVVVMDPAGPTGAFERQLRNRGFVTRQPNDDKPPMLKQGEHLLHVCTSRDYAQACGALVNAVTNDELRHPDQAPLNAAVEHGRSRPVAQAWAWTFAGGADGTPLIGVTLAKLGLDTYGQKPVPQPFVLT